MQGFWLLIVLGVGICRAQLPNNQGGAAAQPAAAAPAAAGQAQLQGAQQPAAPAAPAPQVAPQAIPDEPVYDTLAVDDLAELAAPAVVVPDLAGCTAYAKAVRLATIESKLKHIELKKSLITNLRHSIGDGFVYIFGDKYDAEKDQILNNEKTAYLTASATYSDAGLIAANAAAFYGAGTTLINALPDAHLRYNKHITQLILLKQSWGDVTGYESIKLLMSHDLKLFAERLRLLYATFSDAVKFLVDPATANPLRTTIRTAFNAIQKSFAYVNQMSNDPQKLSLAFLKYLDAKKEHDKALKSAENLVADINARCNATMPPERTVAAVKEDVDTVGNTDDYLKLSPMRDGQTSPVTVSDWQQTNAVFRYVYALALIKMSNACKNQVEFLAGQATTFNTTEFINMYNTIRRDLWSYITAASNYLFDAQNAQLLTASDEAATVMVKTARDFMAKYVETIKLIVPLLNDNSKVASEGEILKTDTEILRTAVVFLRRMMNMYRKDIVNAPSGALPEAYINMTSAMDSSAAVAESVKAYVFANSANPDPRPSVISKRLSLKDEVLSAFETAVSMNQELRSMYPATVDAALHTNVINDLRTLLDAMALEVYHLEDTSVKTGSAAASDFVIPSALLAAGSALLLL